MKLYTFLLLNFIVAFVSDIVLNDLSKMYNNNTVFGSLKPYFKDKGIIMAGLYAGLTILFATIILTYITKFIFGYFVPSNMNELFKTLILGYILGYSIDKLIHWFDIFGPSLNHFYNIVGSGNSGALSFVFSISISYFIQKYIIPSL